MLTYLDLGPPVPTGTLGDELSPLSMITGNAPGFMSVTATDTHFLQIFSTCILPCLLWPAPSCTSQPPSGVQSITRLAGRDVGRRSTCPMNHLRLSATMSCRSPTPAVLHLSCHPSMTLPLCHADIFCWTHLASCLSCQLSSTFHWHRWQMGWQLMCITGASLCFYWFWRTCTWC